MTGRPRGRVCPPAGKAAPPRRAPHPELPAGHAGQRLCGLGGGTGRGARSSGPVNRIDKDTSGLVLAARNSLRRPAAGPDVEKRYDAIAEGELPLGDGVIDAPIGRQAESIIGRCVTPEGKPSRTEYTILEADHGLSLAACVPVTGRTHQIRVHFASIGHPLAGDDLYGGSRERIRASGAPLRKPDLPGAAAYRDAGGHPGAGARPGRGVADRHRRKPAAAGYEGTSGMKTLSNMKRK